MSVEPVLSGFLGFSDVNRGEKPYAEIAENVNLRGRTIRPFFADETIGESGHTNEFIYHEGAWHSGNTNYLEWKINDFPFLFYKESGVWKREVSGTARNLGSTIPGALTLTKTALNKPDIYSSRIEKNKNENGLPPGTYTYYMTLVRVVNGNEYESELSEGKTVSTASTAEQAVNFVAQNKDTNKKPTPEFNLAYPTEENISKQSTKETINDSGRRMYVFTRPNISDANATGWKLYRSDNGDSPRQVGQGHVSAIGEGLSYINDTLDTNRRGDVANETTENVYTFKYVITWLRDTNGYLDESGASPISAIKTRSVGVKLTRPLSVPTGVTKWRIYRISNGFDQTTAFQRVAEVDIGTTEYDDVVDNIDLGAVLPSQFNASDGSLVSLSAPSVQFDGMAGPFNSMMIGWKGSDLYLSQPGKPDLFSPFFIYQADDDILSVEINDSELAVLTRKGCQRGIGDNPQNFSLLGARGEPILEARASAETERGVYYVSPNGLVRIQNSDPILITSKVLDKSNFSGLSGITLINTEDRLFIFHSTGALVLDHTNGQYVKLTTAYTSAFKKKEDGLVYVMTGGVIKKWSTDSASPIQYQYETARMMLGNPDDKRFNRFYFYGTGTTLTVKIKYDDTETATKAITFSGTRDDIFINTPYDMRAREVSAHLIGTAEVTEIRSKAYRLER